MVVQKQIELMAQGYLVLLSSLNLVLLQLFYNEWLVV